LEFLLDTDNRLLETGSTVPEIEVLIEGLNGQLPNLDLVNLVFRLCYRTGIPAILHVEDTNMIFGDYLHSLSTMLQMMFQQASGFSSANHGLFHKYRIEALTLHGVPKYDAQIGFQDVGRLLEGVFRSLNNLLEKFHQSFFFYLLPSPERYVSIGLYMPALGCLMLGPILQVCLLWTQAGMLKPFSSTTKDTNTKMDVFFTEHPRNVGKVMPVVTTAFIAGVAVYFSPHVCHSSSLECLGLDAVECAMGGVFLAFIFTLLLPHILRQASGQFQLEDHRDFSLLHCCTLILLCISIGTLSLLNFSLAFFIAVFAVPVSLLISHTNDWYKKTVQSALLLLVFPPVFLYIILYIYSSVYLADKWQLCDVVSLTNSLYHRGIMSALWGTWTLGTWTYPAVCTVLLPNWLMLWVLVRCS